MTGDGRLCALENVGAARAVRLNAVCQPLGVGRRLRIKQLILLRCVQLVTQHMCTHTHAQHRIIEGIARPSYFDLWSYLTLDGSVHCSLRRKRTPVARAEATKPPPERDYTARPFRSLHMRPVVYSDSHRAETAAAAL